MGDDGSSWGVVIAMTYDEIETELDNNIKVRLQFDFTTKGVDAIDALKKKFGACSRAEVVRLALGLLTTASKGKAVTIEKGNGVFERIIIPV